MRYQLLTCILILASAIAHADEASYKRVKSAVEQYVDDDTIAVLVWEINSQWITGAQQVLDEQLAKAGGEGPNLPGATIASGFLGGFHAAGARELIIVGDIDTLPGQAGPIGILTTEKLEQVEAVHALAESLCSLKPNGLDDLQAVVHEGRVLVGRRATVKRYQQLVPTERDDLVTPSYARFRMPDAEAQIHSSLVISPGPDTRRVIRELWPSVPNPSVNFSGELVADGIKRISLFADCPPDWGLFIAIETTSKDAQDRIAATLDLAFAKLASELKSKQPHLADAATRIANMIEVEKEGHGITVAFSHDDQDLADLIRGVLVPSLKEAREAARRQKRMHTMKQLALAMLNFESSNKALPASAAIVDKNGKPLLSWRVAVLPYLEQQALFDQFHLDEPWDSPHNLKLAKTIPSVYTDPAHAGLSADGKTIYQVPVHARSVFPPASEVQERVELSYSGQKWFSATGTAFRDIVDGSSNTVLVVQTPPEQAVVWTKPADWEVDLAKTLQQLKGAGERRDCVTAFCDGSARIWDLTDEKTRENLPKLITRDGKEVIKW